MTHALGSFAKSEAVKKIVILGDMFELGEYSSEEHQQIADLCKSLKFDVIVLVGEAFGQTQTPTDIKKFHDADAAKLWFVQQDFSGATILLKGSRSMKMENVVT
jgi:UDP-N-acetylmuramoyl-tripeptide--D-alanyl-D-alanine ligase